MTSTILFASDDVLVRQVPAGSDGSLCYVTFASYTDDRVLDRPGFGEGHFRDRGIDAVHVISRDNEWYQYPEWDAALAAVAQAVAPYERVIAYGSSMGGFAALHYGAACGAHLAIAISPQYSVDPAVAPFEDRWPDDVARIRFRREETRALPRQYVVYDPRDASDRRHYELFAARSPTVGLPAVHGGHPAGSFVLESGMFVPLFEGAMAGTLDPVAFAAGLRAGRRRSGQYLFTLSRRVPDHRPRQKLALARMAAEVSGEPLYVSYLGGLLDQAGDFAEAARQHRIALHLAPDMLHPRHAWAVHHELSGQLNRARALIEALARAHPGVKMVQDSKRRIRRRRRHLRTGGRLLTWLKLDPAIDWLSDRWRRR